MRRQQWKEAHPHSCKQAAPTVRQQQQVIYPQLHTRSVPTPYFKRNCAGIAQEEIICQGCRTSLSTSPGSDSGVFCHDCLISLFSLFEVVFWAKNNSILSNYLSPLHSVAVLNSPVHGCVAWRYLALFQFP